MDDGSDAPLDTGGIRLAPPVGRKVRAFFGAGRVTSATLTRYLADLYGERTVFLLDRPLRTAGFEGNVISYRDLDRLVDRAAAALRSLGVRKGDRVALCTANRIELAFVEFGAQRLGAIPVPLNFMLKRDEMAHIVEQSGARVLIVDGTVQQQTIGNAPEKLGDAFGSVKRWVVVTRKPVPPGFDRWDDRVAATAGEKVSPAHVRLEDPAVIFFTSGTTGAPKGAILSSGALLHGVRRYARLAALRRTPRTSLALLVMPLAHIAGHQALLIQMSLACPSLLMGSFDPERILDLVERYRVTMFAGIPTMFRMLLAAGAEKRDLTSMRVWGGGGDAFPAELVGQFKKVGRRPWFITGYGMVETAGQLTINPLGRGEACVGWFLPGVKTRLVDEAGRDVKRGQVGELWVKTPSLMLGYWQDTAGTESAMQDGWFRTGDLLRRDALGLHYFAAREKEMIKVGGYSVFPAEVEAILDTHPAVEQSVVVGLPHPIKGSLPVAAVVRRAEVTEEELLVWARERVARYRCPRRIVFVDGVPLNQSMKPLRRQVRADLLARGVEVETFAEREARAP
jgi:long-chain acyl-CoA synthetase